jgi:hypothetical protein
LVSYAKTNSDPYRLWHRFVGWSSSIAASISL